MCFSFFLFSFSLVPRRQRAAAGKGQLEASNGWQRTSSRAANCRRRAVFNKRQPNRHQHQQCSSKDLVPTTVTKIGLINHITGLRIITRRTTCRPRPPMLRRPRWYYFGYRHLPSRYRSHPPLHPIRFFRNSGQGEIGRGRGGSETQTTWHVGNDEAHVRQRRWHSGIV